MSQIRKILFFETNQNSIIAVSCGKALGKDDVKALEWLFSDARAIDADKVEGLFIGPRREMITPWSTTAVEITQNMNIQAIERIEEFFHAESESSSFDKMLQRMYKGLDQDVFTVNRKPEDIVYITDFEKYNLQEGLALSADEIAYLQNLSAKLGRPILRSSASRRSIPSTADIRFSMVPLSLMVRQKSSLSSSLSRRRLKSIPA